MFNVVEKVAPLRGSGSGTSGKSSKIAKIPNFAREALEPSEARLRGRSGTLLPLNAKAEGLCVPSGRRPGAEGPLAKLGKSEIP